MVNQDMIKALMLGCFNIFCYKFMLPVYCRCSRMLELKLDRLCRVGTRRRLKRDDRSKSKEMIASRSLLQKLTALRLVNFSIFNFVEISVV